MLFQTLTGRRWPILSYAKLASSGAHKVDVVEAQIFLAGRHRLARSELLDLDVQRLDAVGDLARGHAEDAGGFGLDPAGLLLLWLAVGSRFRRSLATNSSALLRSTRKNGQK